LPLGRARGEPGDQRGGAAVRGPPRTRGPHARDAPARRRPAVAMALGGACSGARAGAMKLWVTLDARHAAVEFRTQGEHVWLDVAGRTLAADFHRLPDGEVYSLLVNGRSYEVRVVHGAGGIEVTHHGVTLPVEVRHPLEKFVQSSLRASGASGGETIVAPMPGVVVAVRVSLGERIEAGQAVAGGGGVKMREGLFGLRGGVGSEIRVAERATVGAGQVLLKLAPVKS